jgi:hypothetical protein
MEQIPTPITLACPSAQPDMQGATIFGIVGGTAEAPAVAYLREPQSATPEILALSQPVAPTEVFRLAAPCAQHRCQHFDGSSCQLVARIVRSLPPVEERLPPCRLRPTCRWWSQEGKQACLRCPQIVTTDYSASELLRQVAAPASEPSR